MIDGLHFDLSSDKIAKHLKQRIEYHTNKINTYEESLKKLGGIEDPRDTHSNSGQRDITQRIASHKASAQQLQIMLDNLIPNETYRLDHNDLVQIQMLDRTY